MLKVGDYVTHNTFPPVEGYVSVLQHMATGFIRVGVMQENETVYYDDSDTWDLVEGKNPITKEFIDVECVECTEEND